MKRRIMCLSVILVNFLGVGYQCLGQVPSTGAGVPAVVRPTESAADMTRSGDIPVNLFTGQPNVNIPLHTLSYGANTVVNINTLTNGRATNIRSQMSVAFPTASVSVSSPNYSTGTASVDIETTTTTTNTTTSNTPAVWDNDCID